MIIGISGKINSGKDTIANIINALTDSSITKEEVIELAKGDLINPYPKYQIKKFADKLKDIVCLLLGCTREQLEDREFKERELGEEWTKYQYYSADQPNVEMKMTPRLLLQLLGTECGRQIIHPDIWVNALMADYKEIWNDPDPIPGNDYTITYRWKNEGGTSLIHYGGGSEAEVFDTEISSPNWIITDVRFPNEAKAIKDKGGILIRVNRPLIDKGVINDRVAAMRLALVAEAKINKTGIFHPSETALDDYQDWDYVIENSGSLRDLVDKVEKIDYGKVF